MKRLILEPQGWQCTLEECPAGFFVFENNVCFKTEYRTEKMEIEAYNEAGEFFWGGTESYPIRANLMVQPVISNWVDDEEI